MILREIISEIIKKVKEKEPQDWFSELKKEIKKIVQSNNIILDSHILKFILNELRECLTKCYNCEKLIWKSTVYCYEKKYYCERCYNKLFRCDICNYIVDEDNLEEYIYLNKSVRKIKICSDCYNDILHDDYKKILSVDIIVELDEYSNHRFLVKGVKYGLELELYSDYKLTEETINKILTLYEKEYLLCEYDSTVMLEFKISKPLTRKQIYKIKDLLDWKTTDINNIEYSGGHVHISIDKKRRTWKSDDDYLYFIHNYIGVKIRENPNLSEKYFNRVWNDYCLIYSEYIGSKFYWINLNNIQTLEVRLFSTFASLEYKLNITLLLKLLYYGHFKFFIDLVEKLNYNDLFNIDELIKCLEDNKENLKTFGLKQFEKIKKEVGACV